MFKLSIITVNLNNKVGLEDTIKSVLDQTFKDFEFLIIDGASNDGSIDIINKYSSRINNWISEPDSGIYNAMNKGIKLSKGEYCLFLNSGDLLFNNEVLSTIFSQDISAGIVQGAVMSCSLKKNDQKKLSSISSSDITFYDLFLTSFYHQATFIKTALFNEFGYYEEKYKIIADRVFTLKTLGLNNVSFKYIDIIVSYYNTDGISNNYKSYYETETLPAIEEIIPQRILKDYQTGYFDSVRRIKRYKITWFLFKVLNYLSYKLDQIGSK